MSTLPFNVQARTLHDKRKGPSYLGWNAAGSTFNIRKDASTRTWRATATTFPCFYSAPTLRQLAMILDRDTQVAPALVAPAAATPRVLALYASWQDGGQGDRATWSGLT